MTSVKHLFVCSWASLCLPWRCVYLDTLPISWIGLFFIIDKAFLWHPILGKPNTRARPAGCLKGHFKYNGCNTKLMISYYVTKSRVIPGFPLPIYSSPFTLNKLLGNPHTRRSLILHIKTLWRLLDFICQMLCNVPTDTHPLLNHLWIIMNYPLDLQLFPIHSLTFPDA